MSFFRVLSAFPTEAFCKERQNIQNETASCLESVKISTKFWCIRMKKK